MIATLKRIWKQGTPAATGSHDAELAVTALMVEVMRMDDKLEEAEHQRIVSNLQKRFSLTPAEITPLIERARRTSAKALDMHQFTSVVVKSFTTQERVHILAELWQVAMADGEVDPYEEQLIRRIAERFGLHHRQFIEAKLAAGAS